MIVVTAAGGSPEDCTVYRQIIEAQMKRSTDLGYRCRVYDLGGLGTGSPHQVPASDFDLQVNGDSLPAATFKAALVAHTLEFQATDNELVCWLDADCLPLKDFNPDSLSDVGGFDAAVTLRPAAEIGLSNNPALDYLNSGVVWIRNTPAGRAFCEYWGKQSVRMKTDQGALNQAVMPFPASCDWESWRGRVAVGVRQARVLILDATEWNSWHPPFTGARI